MSAFSDILAAVVAALQAAPAVAGGAVMTNRLRPLAAGVTGAVVVRLDSAQATDSSFDTSDWTTTFLVECYAKALSAADNPDAAVDVLLAEVYERLASLSLDGLGISQVAVKPAIDWQRDEDSAATVCAVLRLDVIHSVHAKTLIAY
jgi:hypothetical protein